MKILFHSFLVVLIFLSVKLFAQQKITNQKVTLIVEASTFNLASSIASQMSDGTFNPAKDLEREVNPKRRDANKAVPGKGLPNGIDPLWNQQTKATKIKGKEPLLSFEAASPSATPTDPTGAVGPNHYVNAWNSGFRIWDKEGNPLTPAASLGTIWPGQTMGDPIVIYDQIADRFLITQFYSNGFLIAVCQGSDPVNDGWYTYQFPTNTFPDYPKFSLWSDGYYITANKNSWSAGTSEVVYVIERDKMLLGEADALMLGFPLPEITTSGFFSPLGFNLNGNQMPPQGSAPIVYMQDDSWSGVSIDHLKIWSIDVDWETPANSEISNPQTINTEPFDGLFDGGSFSNLPQPSGPDLDGLQATIMYMAQYRRFSSYNTVVFNFLVDLDGNDDYSGIRWYELRQLDDGDPWEIYQEGTYVQPEGHSAFSGTMCMDIDGNIGMAYTVVSTTQYPSLRFTGRFSTDPLNVMTLEEESFAEGTQSDPSSRYGDYSQMTIDPTDDKTFWSIAEYFTAGARKNQVGVFKLAPELANDVGIVSIDSPINGILTEEEPVTVTIRNFGVDTQTDIPVSYKVNNGDVIVESYTGSIESNMNEQFTFSTTADLSTPGVTYQIFASTDLGTDPNDQNDSISKQVTHLFANEIGVSTIISPVSGSYLTADETVTVTLINLGALDQINVEVTYVLNDEIPVTEIISDPLQSESELFYSFTTPADLSVIGYHELMVYTSLPGDADTSNDTIVSTIENSLCQPELMCEQGVGVYDFQLGTIYNNTGCSPGGYANYTNFSTNLEEASSTDMTVTTEYGDIFVKVWIDYNDNFVFDSDEVMVDDYVIAPGQNAGIYTETISLEIPGNVTLGEHLFRIKLNYNEAVPADPCEETIFGETEDYTVNIILGTGVETETVEQGDLKLMNNGNNNFVAFLTNTKIEDVLYVTVHNMQGQMLIHNLVHKKNGIYRYDFDMSYAPVGVYLLRLGNNKSGKIKRFVVN